MTPQTTHWLTLALASQQRQYEAARAYQAHRGHDMVSMFLRTTICANTEFLAKASVLLLASNLPGAANEPSYGAAA